MPYINEARRNGAIRNPVTVGDLNFNITQTIQDYLGYDPSYSDFNEVIGVLECVKQELYRRKIAPYEDKKIIENGDVY